MAQKPRYIHALAWLFIAISRLWPLRVSAAKLMWLENLQKLSPARILNAAKQALARKGSTVVLTERAWPRLPRRPRIITPAKMNRNMAKVSIQPRHLARLRMFCAEIVVV